MKKAVSISIGSSIRDKSIEIDLLGERVILERIGTDGDIEKAAYMFQELDGKVDAFGVGGAVLGLLLDDRWYPMHSIKSMVRYVKKTPVVDGTGLKETLERKSAKAAVTQIDVNNQPKTALIMCGLDRYGQARSFMDMGFDCLMGDLKFAVGVPISIRSDRSLKIWGKTLIPPMSRIPFRMLYPTGEAQESRDPKFGKDFDWATVIAGDCHYITRYMPERLDGKIIVTNTTTSSDLEIFQKVGAKCLITTTPVFDGRSFGTNMLEAGLIAAQGRKEAVDYSRAEKYFAEMDSMVRSLDLQPIIQELN